MKIIEIDTDGVLADIHNSLGPYLLDLIPDFSEEKHILNWEMSSIKEEHPLAYKRIFELFVSPEFFAHLPRYTRVIEALKMLDARLDKNRFKLCVNTHIYSEPCVAEREKWLCKLRDDASVELEITIAQGKVKKMLPESYIVVEDSVANCKRSDAEYKFLVRRGHNRAYNAKDLGPCKAAYVVTDFYHAVEIICQENLLD